MVTNSTLFQKREELFKDRLSEEVIVWNLYMES